MGESKVVTRQNETIKELNNAAYGQLERKYETLSNDMRTLQARRRPAAARPPVAHSTRSPAAARRRAPSRT